MQNLAPGKEAQAQKMLIELDSQTEELVKLCNEVDSNSNGLLSREQFQDGVKKGRIPMLLKLLGLNRLHVEQFFDVLSSGSSNGEVEIKSFAQGCMRLSGTATNFDMQMLTVDLKDIQRQQAKDFRDMKRRLQRVEHAMEIMLPVFSGTTAEPMCMDSRGETFSDELAPLAPA